MDLLKSIIGSIAPAVAGLLGGPAAAAVVAMLGAKLLGNSSASPEDIIAALSDPAILVKLKELDVQLATIAASENIAQIEVNKIEASSDDKFKSYGRPAFVWMGVLVCLNTYIVVPYLEAFGLHVPMIDPAYIMSLVTGLLGLGAMRSYDKAKEKKK